ncbi:MAG: hypothetical protein PHU58_07435, partial [Prevotella sp.]|nr:hypothetical protein [Prevotella sp.]
ITGFIYKKKEYRKFASAEEFAPFREWWVKYKKPHGCVGCEFMRAGWYSNEHVMFLGAGHTTSFEDAFRNLEFEDGSPFGVEM